jgi:hypothetical protein
MRSRGGTVILQRHSVNFFAPVELDVPIHAFMRSMQNFLQHRTNIIGSRLNFPHNRFHVHHEFDIQFRLIIGCNRTGGFFPAKDLTYVFHDATSATSFKSQRGLFHNYCHAYVALAIGIGISLPAAGRHSPAGNTCGVVRGFLDFHCYKTTAEHHYAESAEKIGQSSTLTRPHPSHMAKCKN